MTATAAVFHSSDHPLQLQQFSFSELRPGETLVEIDCCTLCGSDLHTMSGARNTPVPTVLGHEIVGRVVETAGPVTAACGTTVQSGDRVCWSITASCGECFFCRHQIPQKCESLFKYGHQQITSEHALSGGLATHCHLTSATQLVKIPEGLPDTVAAPAGCATATIAAALRTTGSCQDQTVVILGAGMLGLTAAAMARTQGARHVLVTDLSPRRRERALQFGATHDGTAQLSELTEGRGADVVVDLTGAPEAMESAVDLLRVGGVLVLVGAVFPNRPLALSAEMIVRRMLRIEGVHNYRPEDLQQAVKFLATTSPQYDWADLVGQEFALADINTAVATAHDSGAFRVAIRPRR